MMETESLQIRIQGDASQPTLIYLPGLHGDWMLVSSFRERMRGRVRFVEFTYPRTLDWSLRDYAQAVLGALDANGIREGVILGESFGSQVAWALLALHAEGRLQPPVPARQASGAAAPFRATMLILAGGFGRYPFPALLALVSKVWAILPAWMARLFFKSYAIVARWRHRHAPETAAAIQEFVARRTPLDLLAMGHRLKLIREHDPGDLARTIRIPVHQLAGFWDPIVFQPAVRTWLRRHCPDYRTTRVINFADHNVLGTAPDEAADQVIEWMFSPAPSAGQRCPAR